MKTVLAIALMAAIGQAFFGRPPRRRGARSLIFALGLAGATAWAVGVIGVYSDAEDGAGAAIALGVMSLSSARWLARGIEGDDGPDDGDEGGGPPGVDEPPPSDWDAFDRARAGWSPRPRDPVA